MEKQEIERNLLEAVDKGWNFYNTIIEKNCFRYFSMELKCSELVEKDIILPDKKQTKHDLPESLKAYFFRKLDGQNSDTYKINKKSCLYFFEFPKGQGEAILKMYREYIEGNNDRSKSALKKMPCLDSNILYVGKVKSNIGARLSTHFGYANPKTGGLQLRHWVNNELIFTIHIIAFDENIDDFINPLELELTKKLKPLIGKSK